METRELNIQIPEGFEIDEKRSTFKKIVFKKIEPKKWRDDTNAKVEGYCIIANSDIFYYNGRNAQDNYNIFATEKQAKSALAAARISQILKNDTRFGGPITNEEWKNKELIKCAIKRDCWYNKIILESVWCEYVFLSFHTTKQAKLFLEENRDLINDYFMIS